MDTSPSTSKDRKVIYSQAREVIFNVLQFMRREVAEGIKIPIKSVFKRVTAATGISTRTLSRIAKEGEKLEGGQFKSPKKTKPQVSPKTSVDDFDTHVIRRTVNQFHITHKIHPTVSSKLTLLLSVSRRWVTSLLGEWSS